MLVSSEREAAWRGPTYVSVAGVDGFYADALSNVFRASSVSARPGEAPGRRHEGDSRGGFSRLPELHVGHLMSAGRVKYNSSNGGVIHEAWQDSTHSISQLGDLVAAGQLDLGLEGQLGSHGI